LDIKSQLLQYCKTQIDERIQRSRESIQFAQEAANTEEKSSAGDKYETGRAMAQRERDQAAGQLAEALKLKDVLDRINPSVKAIQVSLGSLIISDKGKFYIAISLGSLKLDGVNYFIISQESPIGKLLINKTTQDNFPFNNENHTILEIL
jgi:transcription elongation GreA/GreB family factor